MKKQSGYTTPNNGAPKCKAESNKRNISQIGSWVKRQEELKSLSANALAVNSDGEAFLVRR
jgi:hypothetical protein